MRVECDS